MKEGVPFERHTLLFWKMALSKRLDITWDDLMKAEKVRLFNAMIDFEETVILSSTLQLSPSPMRC